MRKNCSSDREKLLKFLRICKIFEITRTIYSNSERSEQFSVTECFFNWRFLMSKKLLGFRNMQEKLEKRITDEKRKILES